VCVRSAVPTGTECCPAVQCLVHGRAGDCDLVFNELYPTAAGDNPNAKCKALCADDPTIDFNA